MSNLLIALQNFFSGSGITWHVCGGHAIDLFVGHHTRAHKDLDVSVNADQRSQAVTFMLDCGWRVFEPDNGALYEVLSPEADRRMKSNLWCMAQDNFTYTIIPLDNGRFDVRQTQSEQARLDYIELLFDTIRDGFFIYRKNQSIRLPERLAFREADGIPYLAPEIVLLYKSSFVKYLDRGETEETQPFIKDYRHDFRVCLPLLSHDQRHWLKEALSLEYPGGHEWLREL